MNKKREMVPVNRTFFRDSKKGQVVIFIIIGILLLFTFGTILFITTTSVEDQIDAEGDPIISSVPTDFEPIQSYTEFCLEKVSEDALKILGDQGGYIYPDLVGKFSEVDPTNSVGILLEPTKIPYWHYNKNPNEADVVTFSSLQPPLSSDDGELSIESQLERYLEENLDGCLFDYSSFEKEGFTIVQGDKEMEVKVIDDGVNFLLKMKLDSKKGDAENVMEKFFVKIPLKLHDYYDLAENIVLTERNLTFLERQGLEALHMYSGVNVNKLPPVSQIRFDAVPRATWVVPDVKKKTEELLQANVPMLRLLGTSNFYRYQYPTSKLSDLYQQNYDNSLLLLDGVDGLDVNFDYFGWPSYFNINSDGDVIKPSVMTASYDLFRMSMQQYYNVYDISYPVMVTIVDDDAFDGKGYKFVFAMESNIRNNAPAENDQFVPTILINNEPSLFCNPTQRNTELIKTIVVDGETGDPLEKVKIGFSIPGHDECTIGETNRKGSLETKYPSAYGGVVDFVKTDYLVNYYPVDTARFNEKKGIIGYATADLTPGITDKVVKLYKKKPIKVSIKKKLIEKCIDNKCYAGGPFPVTGALVYSAKPALLEKTHSWAMTGTTATLSDSEDAIVILNRVRGLDAGVTNDDFRATISVKGDSSQEVLLVPGVYEVTGFLTLNDLVSIPDDERCDDSLLENCFTIAGEDIEGFLGGLIEWNTPKTYFTITPEELYGSSELKFYLPSVNILNVPFKEHVRVMEDLQVSSGLPEVTRRDEVRNSLQPSFS